MRSDPNSFRNSIRGTLVVLVLLANLCVWCGSEACAQENAEYSSLRLSFSQRIIRFWSLLNTDRRLEMNAIGQSLVRDATLPQDKVLFPAVMSIYYVGVDSWKRRAEFLAAADEASRSLAFRWMSNSGESGYWRNWAIYWLESARCIDKSKTANFDIALKHCEQAVNATEAAAQMASWARQERFVDRDVAAALLLKGAVLIAAGREADAELLIAKTETVLKRLPERPYWILRRHLLRNQILLRLSQDRSQAAADLSRRIVALSLDNGVPTSAPRMHEARRLLQDALVAARLWPEAYAEFDSYDRSVSSATGSDERNLVSRALVWMHLGKLTEIEAELLRAAEERRVLLGSDNADAAILLGFSALAALTGSDSVLSAQADERLLSAVTVLLALRQRDDSTLRLQNRETAARTIIQKFLLRPSQAPEITYQAAESLRATKLQRAISDAAIRSSARMPEVADLVRRLQDARGEADTMRGFVDDHAQLSQGARTDGTVDAIRRRLLELAEQQRGLEREIALRDPNFDRLVRPTLPTPAAVQSKLRSGEAFISIVPIEKTIQLWAIQPDQVTRRVVQVSIDEVARLVAALHEQVGNGRWLAPAWPRAAAHQLYRILLEPLAPSLEGVNSLIISVDGALATLPYPALLTESSVSGAAEHWPWLVRKYAISQTPSASAWLAVRQSSNEIGPRRALMAWGDPTFGGAENANPDSSARRKLLSYSSLRSGSASSAESVPPPVVRYAEIPALPETRDELLAVAKSLGGDPERDLFLGSRATRTSVLDANTSGDLARRQVVMFATHGLMAGDLPNLNQPALALAATADADSNPLSPLLTLEDVLTLKLSADWVVLSACNTAAADGKAEEALSGLARGFFYAGARSMLVTHWAVETESAKRLTTAMFEHHSSHSTASKAESLRQSMLNLLAQPKFAHPGFWAAYVLIGDGAH